MMGLIIKNPRNGEVLDIYTSKYLSCSSDAYHKINYKETGLQFE